MFYTIKELANLLKVHAGSVRRWIESGKLKAVKVGKDWRISTENLNDFLNRGRK